MRIKLSIFALVFTSSLVFADYNEDAGFTVTLVNNTTAGYNFTPGMTSHGAGYGGNASSYNIPNGSSYTFSWRAGVGYFRTSDSTHQMANLNLSVSWAPNGYGTGGPFDLTAPQQYNTQAGYYNLGTFYLNDLGSTNAYPVYTNYTMTLVNPSSVYKAKAVWLYNGSVVQTSVLNPSSSGQWTTPSIKVSPAPADNFSLNGNVTILYTQMGNDDGGALIFTNPSSSGGISGSGGTVTNLGGTFSGGTNTVTGGSGSVTVSTNGIVWSAPTGSASESTLQGGFSLLHKDNNDELTALGLINTSITAQTMMQTNQLGQISIWTRSNNDAMWQQTGTLSNLLSKLPTNSPTAFSLTNYATETTAQTNLSFAKQFYSDFRDYATNVLTFLGVNFGTNASTNLTDYVSTNGPFLTTNFDAYISTSNTLDGATVTYDGYTNMAEILAASETLATQTGVKTQENKFDDLLSGITDFSQDIADFYPAVAMTFEFNYGGGTKEMDFDPLHWVVNGGYPFVELFHLVRRVIMWLLALWFLIKITEDGWKVIMVITDSANINASAVKSTIKKNMNQGL